MWCGSGGVRRASSAAARLCSLLTEDPIPEELAIALLPRVLRRAAAEMPAGQSMAIVIDGIQSLAEAQEARGAEVDWLPAALPPRVRLIVSVSEEATEAHSPSTAVPGGLRLRDR